MTKKQKEITREIEEKMSLVNLFIFAYENSPSLDWRSRNLYMALANDSIASIKQLIKRRNLKNGPRKNIQQTKRTVSRKRH